MQFEWLRRFVVSSIASIAAAYVLLTVYLMFVASDESVEAGFARSTQIVGVLATLLVGPTYWLLAKREYQRRAVALGRSTLWGSLASAIIVGFVMVVMVLGGKLSEAG